MRISGPVVDCAGFDGALPKIKEALTVTVGGEAFGILGMLFGVPVCAVLYSLYMEFMKKADARN